MASQAIITALDSPRVKVSLSLWSLGLSLLFLVPGLTPSSDALTLYNSALPHWSDIDAEQKALFEYRDANRQYEESRGWFWSCDASCQSLKLDMLERKAAYEGARARVQAAATEARGHLGIWSTHGVEKAKEVFWGSFNNAMGAAKRSSVFDFIFYGLRAQLRDEGFAEFALKMVFRVLMNITFSVLFGVISFFFQVVGVIRDYNAGFLSGLAFFTLCLLVGLSFFALTCAVVVSAGAAVMGGALYLLANSAEQRRRLQRQD